jgi:pimeloyl-[acyl-carrier protein] methyl ester esterase
MKLILLPGMDGTGKLFAPLINLMADIDVDVIPLPCEGPQDYDSLTKWVSTKLPESDFILLAESFSGPIAANLSCQNNSHLKSVIFVASFLSAPSIWKLTVARCLPIKFLSKMPGARFFYKIFCLGWDAKPDLLNLFESALAEVPQAVLKARLKTMANLTSQPFTSNLPVIYIQATEDKLVPVNVLKDFFKNYPQIDLVKMRAPHFLLQAKPEESAKLIRVVIEKN